jgi:hypothetical protein
MIHVNPKGRENESQEHFDIIRIRFVWPRRILAAADDDIYL